MTLLTTLIADVSRREALAGGLALGLPCQDGGSATWDGVSFLSNDKQIRSILYYPPGGVDRRSGVVMMHGSGMRIRSEGLWHQLAIQVANAGFWVLTPGYYDAAFDDGVRPEPVMQAWRDVCTDGTEWLANRIGVSQDRIGAFGYSLGTHVAVDSALREGRAGAAMALAGGWDVYIPRVPTRRIPVLILRCEDDTHVSPASTRRWAAFLREHDVPLRVQVLADAPHIPSPDRWPEIGQRTIDFFAGNVGRT